MKVVITGCLGSGKSTVYKELVRQLETYSRLDPSLSFAATSVDDIVRHLYFDPEIQKQLKEAFGTIERREISERVFTNSLDMSYLRHIFDDVVSMKLNDFLDNHQHCVVEFPLFFDFYDEFKDVFDVIVVVKADYDVCIKRAVARDSISEEKAARIIARQNFLRDDRFWVALNNQSLSALHSQIYYMADRIAIKAKAEG